MNTRSFIMLWFACCFIFFTFFFWGREAEVADAYSVANSPSNNASSIFDTCPLVLFNHLDPVLLPYYHPNYNPKANCKVYEPLTELTNGKVNIRKNAKGFKCKARCILPAKVRKYTADTWIELPSNHTFECDVVETKCANERTIESFLHMQIYEKAGAKASSRHDVYLLIIDSTSSFMAKRSLPKTLKYLEEEMGAVQMEFLNKVGDNSRPNGFPLAFGKSVEGGSRDLVGLPPLVPDWNNTEICKEYLDGYSYHLKDYAKKGYKTMIAEDYGVGIVYYQNCSGFRESDADHMWWPFDVRREESGNFKKGLEDSCSERHLEMLEYLEKFMHAYRGTPKIAQVWPSTLAHETLKDLFHSDEHFLRFFQKNKKIVDNSFFIFMGDHGPRREGIGMLRLGQYENLNPFLMVIIPAQYRNTSLHTQLKQKAPELMTNFDLHATLMDILELPAIRDADGLLLQLQPSANFTDTTYRDMMPLSKGSSLLREWRGPRNCRTLPIPSQYCICQYDKVEVTDAELKLKLGQFFASELNSYLLKQGLHEKCQEQYYNQSSHIMEIKDRWSTLYDVAVYLKPSNGLFSAFIRSSSKGDLTMSSSFTRLDRYGKQGDCLVGNVNRPLCHCKGTTTP